MSTLPSLFVSNDRDGTAATAVAAMPIPSTDASASAIVARTPLNVEMLLSLGNARTVPIGVLLRTIVACQICKIRSRDQSVSFDHGGLPQQRRTIPETVRFRGHAR